MVAYLTHADSTEGKWRGWEVSGEKCLGAGRVSEHWAHDMKWSPNLPMETALGGGKGGELDAGGSGGQGSRVGWGSGIAEESV